MKSYVDARLPLEDRVAAFAEARAKELEFCSPVRRAASVVDLSATKGSTAISRATDEAWQRRRREVEQVFAAELEHRRDLLDALDMLTHGRTWDTMRYAMQLSPSAATALLTKTIAAVIRT
jgi:hypothetical protein